MTTTTKDILHWLKGSFAVESVKGNEVKMPCPICEHPNFYFNIRKRTGWCHRASCHWTPKLKDLIDHVGYGPEDAGWVPREEKENKPTKVELPYSTLIYNYTCYDNFALMALMKRGLPKTDIIGFGLRSSYNYIYIPIYYQGKLVQYVGRRIDRSKPHEPWNTDGQRYRYASGVSITNYLFNWDYFKYHRTIGLVENTFNAIMYGFSSNFGSHLSDNQADMIQRSAVRAVAIIWDEGTEEKAEKAVNKLRARGVRAAYASIKKQPDDHSINTIRTLYDITLKTALKSKHKQVRLSYDEGKYANVQLQRK